VFLDERFSVAVSILIMPLLAARAIFVGLWLTSVELNFTAMMGITRIIGILTEVTIFLFSEFDGLSSRGMLTLDALIGAGRNRMRPIVMTTIAAILTPLPLALAIGQGAAMQQPLAIATVSGLTVQLPLVLLVTPALYIVISRPRARFRQFRRSQSWDRHGCYPNSAN
jgi:multidrug efflux pump subunit AcrB